MKKEIFKYLYSFNYKNKEYIYLFSKNYPFYFLEYNKKTLSFEYPDFNVFKELYNVFYSDKSLMTFDLKSELKKIKEKICELDIEATPFIRTTSGLLSIAIALSMCGCTQTEEAKETTTTEPTSIVETYDKNQDIYNYFKKYGMYVINREYDGNDYIFVETFTNSNNKTQNTLESFEDFRRHININFIPTWNDVISAFQNNPNIDNDKKDIILSAIKNLEQHEELKEMDLSVLYANAKRMNIKYLSTEEMINTVGRDSVYAYFDTTSGTVFIPNDKQLETFEFIHEVIGHGALAYREETDTALTVFDCTNYLMLPTDDRYTGHSVGIMVSEGGANLLAHLATNDYSVSTFYELYEEELRAIAALCNVSIGELFNHKGISLYDLMYKNKINTPVEYIFKMDGIYKGQIYCEFSDLMERLFVDATEEKFMAASGHTQDEIISSTIEIIRNSHLQDREELSFSYPGGSIDYSFEDSASRYEDNMNAIRNSK